MSTSGKSAVELEGLGGLGRAPDDVDVDAAEVDAPLLFTAMKLNSSL